MTESKKYGKVYLVGSGPGDAGLFTVKGMECLKTCDVLVYDYLVNEELLQYCRADAEKIYVGKKAKDHTLSQPEINKLLVKKAKEGKTVTRLKGGDPYVFGRGGEEALELADNGIEFEVVPGVTAAVAASAYAGIPITHRGYTSTAALITGHEDPSKEESDLHWDKIAAGIGTLVFYMGVKNLPNIVGQLIKYGRDKTTPVALIRWGTYNYQKTVTGTLEDIVEKVEKAGLKPPALIVVGEVVSLREKLRWFDNRPLFGKRIVVTRSRGQISAVKRMLQDLGATVIEFPTIDIRPVDDFTPLKEAFGRISEYGWIVFTSVNAVDIFFQELYSAGYDSRSLAGAKIAVIGKETGECLINYGISPDLTPDSFTSEGTVAAFKAQQESLAGCKVLLPCSELARSIIPDGLRSMGADVDMIYIYRNVIPEYSAETVEEIFSTTPDLVTFTSSSTISNLVDILKNAGKENFLKSIRGASIGPVTTQTAEDFSVKIEIEAAEHTVAGLIDKISDYFTRAQQ